MFWKHHIDIVANKLINFSGVLDKMKKSCPCIYCAHYIVVQSRLTYGILAWGFECQRLIKIQMRFMIIFSVSTCNAHRAPLFKQFELLPTKCLSNLNGLKFVYDLKKGNLPCHF